MSTKQDLYQQKLSHLSYSHECRELSYLDSKEHEATFHTVNQAWGCLKKGKKCFKTV